jgi:ABC-type glycerol-3-phosphate transport system substrate-binding protein
LYWLPRKFQENDVIGNSTVTAKRYVGSAIGISLAIVVAIMVIIVQSPAFAQTTTAKGLAVIPPDKDTDLKFYQANGETQNGAVALGHMASDADLVLWLAGNQFFAMDEVIGVFKKTHPGVTVGLITLPPGRRHEREEDHD